MKKTLISSVFLLAIFFSLSANAQFCVQFSTGCDALEVDVNGTEITGTWLNIDCAGSAASLYGTIVNNQARIGCLEECMTNFSAQYGFLAETNIDGTLDRYIDPTGTGQWMIEFDELEYSITPGGCSL